MSNNSKSLISHGYYHASAKFVASTPEMRKARKQAVPKRIRKARTSGPCYSLPVEAPDCKS